MAKGFSQQPQQGFALLLIPSAKAYAARHDLNINTLETKEEDESFMGLTNRLEDVQIWQTKEQAKNALNDYIPFLIEEILDSHESQLCIQIREIFNKKGKLKSKIAEELYLMKESDDMDIQGLD